MYSSVHGVTGAIIMVASPNPIVGACGAFISHFLWDYVGESSIGDTKESSIIEGSLLFAFLLSSGVSGLMFPAVIGWVMGNIPDLIDKPNDWFRGKKQWFSCHNGRGLFRLSIKGKTYKLGYPVAIRITKDQTILFNTFATIVWLLVCVVLK